MAKQVMGFNPLYQQVYDYLTRKIIDGKWRAAESLPSEQVLAAELGVSQGTVRKALDVMVAENLVERRQGKGTFVAEHTQARAQFRFFRLAKPKKGGQVSPQCANTVIKRRVATERDTTMLDLAHKSEVYEIKRLRLLGGHPIATEIIVVPAKLFPDLDRCVPLPNALYSLYQSKFGINIVLAEEELTAIVTDKTDSTKLKVPVGKPILHIDRIAIGMDGKKVEWRRSRCLTDNLVYSVNLR